MNKELYYRGRPIKRGYFRGRVVYRAPWREGADLLAYLPHWFRGLRDYLELMETESEEMDGLWRCMEQVRKNLFVQSCDEATIKAFEGLFGIIADLPAETMALRRERILNRLSVQPPFTMRFLRGKLDQLIGPGKWTVRMDYPNYTLYIEAAAENQSWAGEVLATINTIKPCHIVYRNNPLLVAGLRLSETVGQEDLAYHYHLGGWVLGALPFGTYTDRGGIVTAEQKTILEQLLGDVAAFTAEDVACARVNGVTEITRFEEKKAEGALCTVAYLVSPAQAGTITQLELLNAAGQVLERAPVYIPVGDAVRITHRIPVKEGT